MTTKKQVSLAELKLLMLNPYVDDKNLHVYKITGSDAVFVTKIGNAPFADEIKNHINGKVIDSKFHICKTYNSDEYFITEFDNCGILPESYDNFYENLIYELGIEIDNGGFRKMTNI